MLRFVLCLFILTSHTLWANCPSRTNFVRQAREENRKIDEKKELITKLLKGNWDRSPESVIDLLQLDPSLPEQVNERIAILQTDLKKNPYRPSEYQNIFACFDQYKIQKLKDEFTQNIYDFDRNRLFFLRLPTQVQEILIDPAKQVSGAYDDVRTIQERLEFLEDTKPALFEQEQALLSEMLTRARDDLVITSKLKQLDQEMDKFHAPELINKQANLVWRQLVDDTFNTFRLPQMNFPSKHEHQKREEELKKEADTWLKRGIERHYKLLVEAGQLRARSLQASGQSLWLLTNWSDIRRELKVVPYRFSGLFYSKIIDVRQKIRQGLSGIGSLARDILIFLALFIIPIMLRRAFSHFDQWLDEIRAKIIHIREPNQWQKAAAIWILRLRPFLPWFFWFITLEVSQGLIVNSVIEELSLLIPYFKYFVLYRIFKQAILIFLTSLKSHGGLSLTREIKLKASHTATALGRVALISFSLIHAVESIVSHGLIYELLFLIIKITVSIYTLILAMRWHEETLHAILANLNGKSSEIILLVDKKIPRILTSIVWLCSAFVFEFISLLKTFGSDFDLSKRLSAQVFRRQLQSSDELVENDEDPRQPIAYKELFNHECPPEDFIYPEDGAFDKVKNEIDEWDKELSDEHTVALYGDKGSGKSTILAQLENHYKDFRVIRTNVNSKLLSRSDVLNFFGKLLEVDLSDGGKDLIEYDKTIPPTLILLDEAQNMFLSRVGGFEGYKTLLDLIGTRTDNIFWVVTFNRYSWAFLNAVFGRNQYFRTIVRVHGWNDDDIRNLIMTNHQKGEWSLSFDAILQAVGSNRMDDAAAAIEAKFFKLLWQQSGGNPRAAQDLWLSALSRKRSKQLRVGLPSDPQLNVLKDISDDSLFVYSGIIRHENLSTIEAAEVTDLPEGIVRHALRVGLENEFLRRSEDGRYQVLADSQRALISYLRKRNFIYGG